MALYDYYCEANGRTVEVRHGMDDAIATWGELCETAGVDAGDTNPGASVVKKMGAPVPITGGSSGSGQVPCGPSCGCAFDG